MRADLLRALAANGEADRWHAIVESASGMDTAAAIKLALGATKPAG